MMLYIYGHSYWGIKVSTYIYSATVIILLFSRQLEEKFNAKNFLNRIITYIGTISFAIYLTHCYIITIVFKHINVESYILRWIIVSLISILVVSFLRKTLPSKFHKCLGLV